MRSGVVLLLASLLAACSEEDSPDASAPDAAVASADATSSDATSADAAIPDAELPDATSPDASAEDGGVLRVLFVGNSYTQVNDLPSVVGQLAAATPGPRLEIETVAVGGARLVTHWTTTGARERIESGDFDVIVMQAQSVEPFLDPKSFHFYGELFSGALEAAGARGVWFSTWARREGDAFYAESGYTPASMTEALEYRYRIAAAVNGDRVARAGAAWQLSLAELSELTLHDPDGSHPSAHGTLLAACVILQAITGTTPRSPDPAPLGIALAEANALCDLAPRVICPEGQVDCSGDCFDLSRDPFHCGTCDRACSLDDPCNAGECGCGPDLSGCGRVCYDLSSSNEHCGSCELSCAADEHCEENSCICSATGAQTPALAELTALNAACDSWDDAGTLECNAAAHDYCETFACWNSGYGPPSGHAPPFEGVLCVNGDVRATSYTELSAFVPACDGAGERIGQSCSTAFSRYCASQGAVSGFGPIESADDDLTVTCVSTATIVQTTMTTLSAFASRCVPDPVSCSIAAWNFCESMGYAGGFGPVELNGEDAEVVCL
jgi:hypothetical protein